MELDDYDSVMSRVSFINGTYVSESGALESFRKEIEGLDASVLSLTKAQQVVSHLMEKLVNTDLKEMDRLVTYGLKTVFPDRNITFKSELKDSGKKIFIDLKTLDNGTEIDDDAKGSVTVIESFLLRLICILKLKRPKVLFMDETFAAVDSGYINNVGALISELATRMGMDVLLVTHNPGASDAQTYRATLVDSKDGKEKELSVRQEGAKR